MNRHIVWPVALIATALAACGGGGSTPGPVPTPVQTAPPVHYSLQLHWEPAGAAGISTALRHAESMRVMDTGTQTVVVQSSNGGSSPYDISDPAYVTVSVSPAPSPAATVSITTNSPVVSVSPTPAPLVPNPSASPAALLVGQPNTTDTGHTVTATLGTSTTTDNIIEVASIALVAPKNGAPTLPDAVGFTFDSNCNAVPQAMTTGSDVYITYGDNAVIGFPGGGTAIQHGFDVSTLTASDWSNAETSIGVNALGVALDDTIIFKAANGKIVYLAADSYGGAGSSSAATMFVGGYGCLN